MKLWTTLAAGLLLISFLNSQTNNIGIGTDQTRSLLTLRGPDHADEGPILTFYGNDSDQRESGRIRFIEATLANNWRGCYIKYDGISNWLQLGVHNTNDTDVANDIGVLTIDRNTQYVGIQTSVPAEDLVLGHNVGNGLAGTRMTIGDPGDISGINLGESGSDRGWILWHPNNDLIEIGTSNNNIQYASTLTMSDGMVGVGTDAYRSLFTLRGPDNSTAGPNISLYGEGSDQTESGRIRFIESTSSGSWRGAYLHYNGNTNRLHIGAHSVNDTDASNDDNYISINRNNGRVGINNENPSELLHISGGDVRVDRGSSNSGLTRRLVLQGARSASGSAYASIDFRNYDSDTGIDHLSATIDAENTDGNGEGNLKFNLKDNGTLFNILWLEADGSVGINHSPHSVFGLTVNGHIVPYSDGFNDLGSSMYKWNSVWANNPIIQTSDRREKTNIKPMQYGLREVMALKPVKFEWIKHPEQGVKIGLIAQDLVKVIPEAVKTHDFTSDPDTGEQIKVEIDRYGVTYSDLIPVLINAIQEQQEMIDQQNIELSLIRAELDKFKQQSYSEINTNGSQD